MQKHELVWIRIAGHTQRIHEKSEHPWRCYVDREPPEIPLASFQISGEVTHANMLPGIDPEKANACGLLAWIDCFGDILVEDDGVARITLRYPNG